MLYFLASLRSTDPVRHGAAILVIALLAGPRTAAAAPGTPEEEMQAAENTFRFQDYRGAAKRLGDLLYPDVRLGSPDLVIRAREYLGASHFFLGDEKRMEEEFTALLVLAPLHRLDPFYYPAPLIERFEALRRRLAELKVISLDPPRKAPEPARCERQEATVVRRSRVASFMPLGIGQFQNGEPVKGGLFLSGQLLALGMNIGGFLGTEALRGSDGMYSPADAARARDLRYVQYVGLGALAALVVWGVIDSAVRFRPEDTTFQVVPCPPARGPGDGPAAPGSPVSMCVRY
ncbi:MAG: hypothetical protein FJ087_14835 [Deltaproteobacteria bacterium]|nr:hypothetical protein [Deltaproteobacteria bacterium]